MDQKERSADFTAALKVALSGWQRSIETASPGIIVSYDAADNTATVQPAVRAVVLAHDKATGKPSPQHTQLPLLVKVPIVWPAGGGFTLTFPLKAGDEVLVVFGSRCIDAWWQSGGVQNQIEFRAHDLSDGFAIPGPRSVPSVIGSISSTGAELRADDGSCILAINSGGEITLKAPGAVRITGDLFVAGNITATGTISG